jgi:hypothetical protein
VVFAADREKQPPDEAVLPIHGGEVMVSVLDEAVMKTK